MVRKTSKAKLLAIFLGSAATLFAQSAKKPARVVTAEDRAAVAAAMPEALLVPAQQGRCILVFSRSQGFYHRSTPLGNLFFEKVGEQFRGYRFTFSDAQEDYGYEKLKAFDAIIFNNGTRVEQTITDPEIRAGILRFVEEGGGVLGIHAATDGGAPQWPGYSHQFCNRFGGHPWKAKAVHSFLVEEPGHPLVRHMPGPVFQLQDEIYISQDPFFSRDTARVLISMDLSDPVTDSRSSSRLQRGDRDYAVSQLARVGQGRMFYTSFGHRDEIFANRMILTHYLAAMQYVAGDLEAPDSPVPFYDRLRQYDGRLYYEARLKLFHQSQQASDPAAREEAIELCRRLVEDVGATWKSRQLAVNTLAQMGTPEAAAVISSAVEGATLTFPVLLALSRHQDAETFAATLRQLLGTQAESGCLELINALGTLGRIGASEPLVERIHAGPDSLRLAAVRALGQTGTAAQVRPLQAIPATSFLAAARDQSLLQIAARQPGAQAVEIYRTLFNESESEAVIEASFRGWIRADPSRGRELWIQALHGEAPNLLRAAIQASTLLEGPTVTAELEKALALSDPPYDEMIIQALLAREDPQLPQILENALGRDNTRHAAMEALSVAGTDAQVPAILRFLSGGDAALAKAAAATLSRMPGPAVDRALAASLRTAQPGLQETLLKVCEKRKTSALGPVTIGYLDSEHAGVAAAALRAVAFCGGFSELEGLCRLAARTEKNSKFRGALRVMANRLGGDTRMAGVLIGYAKQAPSSQRELFLSLLTEFPTPESLAYLVSQLGSDTPELQGVAIRALSRWEGSEPVDYLIHTVARSRSEANQSLAYREAVAMIEKSTDLPNRAKLDFLEKLLGLAYEEAQSLMAVKAFGSILHPSVDEILQGYAQHGSSALREAAAAAIRASHEKMKTVEWSLVSSHNNNPAALAQMIDGKRKTRWSSRLPMKSGRMWVLVDLGFQKPVHSLTLDTTRSADDFPREYELYLSDDGEHFPEEPAARGKGAPITEIQCDAKGRYLKIVQTGQAGPSWSIHELKINGQSAPGKDNAE